MLSLRLIIHLSVEQLTGVEKWNYLQTVHIIKHFLAQKNTLHLPKDTYDEEGWSLDKPVLVTAGMSDITCRTVPLHKLWLRLSYHKFL